MMRYKAWPCQSETTGKLSLMPFQSHQRIACMMMCNMCSGFVRWWAEYSDRKNDEGDEHVSDSLLYDR